MNDKTLPPILRHKNRDAPSVFTPDGLMREADERYLPRLLLFGERASTNEVPMEGDVQVSVAGVARPNFFLLLFVFAAVIKQA